MPPRPVGPFLVAIALSWLGRADASAAASRTVVDRIVAVVDDDCITSSELERFAAPFIARATSDLQGKPRERDLALAEVRKEAVRGLIDRILFDREATRVHVSVTPAEVDAALDSIAAQNHMARDQILAAARKEGLDEQRYRAELRAQIVEAKLIQLDAARRYPDWKVLRAEARIQRMGQAREALLGELRAGSFIEVRL